MKSFSGSSNSLVNTFTTLSQNSSNANGTLATILLNDQHRYYLLKYFDNERAVNMLTVGSQTIPTVTAFASGATSATLTNVWPSVSCQQLVVFSNSEQRTVNFFQNGTTATWVPPLTTSAGTAVLSCQGVQAYPLPANVSKVKNGTITVGQLVYTAAPVQSIQEWTKLNALPYNSAYPAYFFVFNNQLSFWPIPSTSNQVVTIYCQINVADMTYSDYTSPGTIAMTVGSNVVTGSSTTWASSFPTNVDLTFANLYLSATPTGGDGLYYQIQSFTDNTHLTLLKPVVNAPSASGVAFKIGQYPLLDANFHDSIIYGALRIYYSSIAKDPEKFQLYEALVKEKEQQMSFYLSTKQVNVDLSVTPVQTNPNLYIFGQ